MVWVICILGYLVIGVGITAIGDAVETMADYPVMFLSVILWPLVALALIFMGIFRYVIPKLSEWIKSIFIRRKDDV